jgi:hypothetical protein
VAGDEDAVLRGDQVRLDVVRAHPGGEGVGRERVLGAVARGTAVADDERRGLVGRVGGGAVRGRREAGEQEARDRQEQRGEPGEEGGHRATLHGGARRRVKVR